VALRLFSIGHGTRTLDDFVAILGDAGVTQIADVRAYPGSRRHPHFGRAELERTLPAAGVAYAWLPALGGMRKGDGGGASASRHPGLKEEAFRAYADHTDSAGFAAGLERLLALAAERPTAFMCAERDPAGCHRSILADKLWSGGIEVVHLVGIGEARVHQPPPSLRVEARAGATHLRYDVGTQALLF
jgi:uncharacterized protein (DUF488 family)